jgi:tetratricopeptide (TPR) repeat protein
MAFTWVSGFGQDAGTESLFMEYGAGARAQGFGKAFVAVANDGSAVFWNPAGLDYIPQSNFIAYHSTLLGGGMYNFASLSYPFLSLGAFGLGISRFSVDGISLVDGELTRTGMGSTDQEEVYLSYGKRLPFWGLSLGSTFKIIRQSSPDNDFGTVTGFGTGLDLGLLYRPDFDAGLLQNISVGLNVQNVIRPSVKLIDIADTQPMNIKFGVARDFLFGEDNLRKLTLAVDVNKSQQSDAHFNAGGEFLFSRYLKARAGYDNGQMAAGFGTEFQQFEKFSVDYAVGLGSPEGSSFHRLSLTIHFGKTIEEQRQIARARRLEEDQKLLAKNQEEVRARSIKEHTAMGREFFRDGKLIQALVEWEQVTSLDPDNETSKIYIDSINYLMDKQLAEQLADTASAMKSITILEENEKFVKDHYRKGYQLVQKGDYLAAIAEFQAAFDRAPNNVEIANSLKETRSLLDKKIAGFIAKARSSAAANNFAEALKLLSEARALDPNNQLVQKEIDSELRRINNRLNFLENTRNGLDAYQRADYQAAMELFEKALLIDPTNETVKEYHKKAIVRAFATFKNLEGDNEKTYLQGVDLYVEGKYEQAILIWKRILEKDPLNRRVLNAVDKAEQQLEQLKRNPPK